MRPRLRAPGSAPPSRRSTPAGPSSRPHTPYHYSTYEDEDEVRPSARGRGSSSSARARTASARASSSTTAASTPRMALREAGYETVMVNCNPETVSTDYDTSDRLYFEPLTAEDVADVHRRRAAGRSAAAAGRASSSASAARPRSSWPLGSPRRWCSGTRPASIDLAEDRERWNDTVRAGSGIPQPPGGHGDHRRPRRVAVAARGRLPGAGAPELRARRAGHGDRLRRRAAASARGRGHRPACGGSLGREGGVTAERPVLVDRFLEDAIEVDVDAVRDATGEVLVAGVMEHVEEAGVHSGDSACALPPQTLRAAVVDELERHDARHRRGARGQRADQRAVRGEGRPGLRARGQPAGQPHGARSWPRRPGCRWPWWRPG